MDNLKINPVSQTAMVTLDFLRGTDIPYVQDFSKLFNIEQLHQMMIGKSDYQIRYHDYPPKIEARLKGTDILIKNEGNPNILDLACGFTSRCIYMAKEGFHYVGADLPFVIEKVKPAVATFIDSREELQEYQSKIHYSVADVTDYSALEKATAHLSGPITVTCEGLLCYLPAYEQKEVAKNIHALLSKHGGVWITSDLDVKYDNVAESVANFIFKDVTEKQISPDAVNSMEQACRMFEDIGFHVSKKEYCPQLSDLTSLSHYSDADRELLYRQNAQWNYLILHCK